MEKVSKKNFYLYNLIIICIYFNFLFNNAYIQILNIEFYDFGQNILIFSKSKIIFSFTLLILFSYYFFLNFKYILQLFKKDILLKVIFYLLIIGSITIINFLFINNYIFFSTIIIYSLCFSIFIFFRLNNLKFSWTVYSIVILVNIIFIIIFFVNYLDNIISLEFILNMETYIILRKQFYETIYTNLSYFPKLTNPINQKFIFLIINSFFLLHFIKKDKFLTSIIILFIILINFLIIFTIGNFYSKFFIIMSLLYFIFNKILNKYLYSIQLLSKKIIFLFLIFFSFVILTPIPHSIGKNYISFLLKKNQSSNYCINFFEFEAFFIPDFFINHKNISYRKLIYQNYKSLKCDKDFAQQIAQLNNKVYTLIGLFSRIEQSGKYFDIKNNFTSLLLIGTPSDKYLKNINNGNFTHNSYLNLLAKHGLVFTFLFFIFIYFLLRSYKTPLSLSFFLFIFFSQLLDDYLLGNRSELSFLIWFVLSISVNKLKLNKNQF